jgi:HK97 gp10 family phage protein
VTQGTNKTLQDITADAKENCPVDTGQLRESIEPYGKSHEAKSDGKVISGAAGTDVEHGVYVEMGTGPVGLVTDVPDKCPADAQYTMQGWTYYDEKNDRFIHTEGQPAQPFLWPAYQAHAKELSENIKKAADAEVGRLAK